MVNGRRLLVLDRNHRTPRIEGFADRKNLNGFAKLARENRLILWHYRGSMIDAARRYPLSLIDDSSVVLHAIGMRNGREAHGCERMCVLGILLLHATCLPDTLQIPCRSSKKIDKLMKCIHKNIPRQRSISSKSYSPIVTQKRRITNSNSHYWNDISQQLRVTSFIPFTFLTSTPRYFYPRAQLQRPCRRWRALEKVTLESRSCVDGGDCTKYAAVSTHVRLLFPINIRSRLTSAAARYIRPRATSNNRIFDKICVALIRVLKTLTHLFQASPELERNLFAFWLLGGSISMPTHLSATDSSVCEKSWVTV